MDAPTVCRYCDGHGLSSAGGRCGFCEDGTPLDTQADWDGTWGRLFAELSVPSASIVYAVTGTFASPHVTRRTRARRWWRTRIAWRFHRWPPEE